MDLKKTLALGMAMSGLADGDHVGCGDGNFVGGQSGTSRRFCAAASRDAERVGGCGR
jgi:hypothetical protein